MTDIVFYSYILNKKIPGTIVPDYVHRKWSEIHLDIFLKIDYNFNKFDEFDLSQEEVYRYENQIVNIKNIYPYSTQEEKDHADICIPNIYKDITTNYDYKTKELDRYKKLIDLVTDVTSISVGDFYTYCEYVSYELLFTLCNYTERVFYQTISAIQLTEQPETIEAPQMLQMMKRIFNKFPNVNDITVFKIHNYNHLEEFNYISFPIILNVVNLKYNTDFIII